MTSRYDPADEPFFREWNAARSHEAAGVAAAQDTVAAGHAPKPRRSIFRSRERSALLQKHLGLKRRLPVPACLIVGSKGKGTAVAAATAALSAAGLRTGTITSPPHRHNRERIRIDGRAISHEDYRELSRKAVDALDALPKMTDGYLPPSGMFTLFGLRYLIDAGVQALVVEEGLGGLSDDVSLFSYPTVGVTQVFEEHLDVLGGSLDAVAADLLGVIDGATEHVVSFWPQVEEAASRLPENTIRIVEGSVLEQNIGVGLEAARSMLTLGFENTECANPGDLPTVEDLKKRLILPGRASKHRVDGTTWCVDTAISSSGVAAIRRHAERALRPGFHVLAAFPDVKDVEACLRELQGLPVTLVGAGRDYLDYERSGAVLSTEEAMSQARGNNVDVLAVGTQSFAGEVLELIDAETDRWFY